MLQVRKLTKWFDDMLAVDAANLVIDKPCVLGLLGSSGAGKSTLLRMIGGAQEPTSGAIVFEGQDVLTASRGHRSVWESQCAMIHQPFNRRLRSNVVSHVLRGASNHNGLWSVLSRTRHGDTQRATELLERLGIAELSSNRIDALSGGQLQRVLIARALMQDPKVLLADDPIASLDPLNAQRVMEILRRLYEDDGRTVVVALHTLDAARRYCDRVVGMRDGRIVFDGLPEQLTTGVAREIYGAGSGFLETLTSKEITVLGKASALASVSHLPAKGIAVDQTELSVLPFANQ